MILVLTPTLGTSAFIEETCASVAAVMLPKRHVLVCPEAKIAELRARFPACEVVADAGREGGLYGALNAGLAAAGAWDWFTYINDDDTLGRDFATFAERHMRADNERVIGYGDVSLRDEARRRLGVMSVEKNPARFVPLLDAGVSPVSQQGMLFSRAVVDALGGYRPQWRLCGDQDFWLRALKAGFAFQHFNGEVGCFRVRAGQLSGDVGRVEVEMAAITREQFPEPTTAGKKRAARVAFRARNLRRIAARVSRTGWKTNAELLAGDGAKRAGRPVFINGLGCLESGARVVLRDLMRVYPADAPRGILVMPAGNRRDVDGLPANVRVIALSHRVFGRWLRPLYEAAIWGLAKLGAFSSVVNLSHYGWCPGGNYVLYFHNELLVAEGHDDALGRAGRPNGFKRWCLRTCLRRAKRVVVQTERVARRVREYAAKQGIANVQIEVVAPRCDVEASGRQVATAAKAFPFTFFYPTSSFAHKRADLAIAGIVAANRRDPRVGLVITLPKPGGDMAVAAACISYAGTLTTEQVIATYRSADALLFTSSNETLGLPLLEALEFRLPAVLPALDYARDVYGAAGSYFEESSAEAVANAVLACVRDRERLAAEAAVRRELQAKTSRSWAEHWEIFGVKRP